MTRPKPGFARKPAPKPARSFARLRCATTRRLTTTISTSSFVAARACRFRVAPASAPASGCASRTLTATATTSPRALPPACSNAAALRSSGSIAQSGRNLAFAIHRSLSSRTSSPMRTRRICGNPTSKFGGAPWAEAFRSCVTCAWAAYSTRTGLPTLEPVPWTVPRLTA